MVVIKQRTLGLLFLSLLAASLAFSCDDNKDEKLIQSFVVGPEGGTFAPLEGVSVVVPKGALEKQVTLTVETLPGETAASKSKMISSSSRVWRISPEDTTLRLPLKITLPYDADPTLNTGMGAFLAKFQNDDFVPIPAPKFDQGKATFSLSHIGRLVIGHIEGEKPAYPACGSNRYEGRYMVPGPVESGYDQELAKKARNYDRQFHVFNAAPMAINADLVVRPDSTEKRNKIEEFLKNDEGWDFKAYSGMDPMESFDELQKVAGLYAGNGVAADAMRYAVLRDQGADCEEIEIARQHLLAALDATHIAFSIAGKPGVVARGFIRTDVQGAGKTQETIPLQDDQGNPLPAEKNNGVWRQDFSGLYPNYIWEDSCSRDMMLGWAAASGVGMQAIRDDESFPEVMKQRLRDDSKAVLKEFRTVRESGYDLEFPDADGRTTFHGYINEHCVERVLYTPSFKNGFYAMMALGIVGAFTYAAEDPEADAYLYEKLIKNRKLPEIARDNMIYISMGRGSNYSNYSMVFTSAWLAMRFVKDETALAVLQDAIERQLYNNTEFDYQPVEQKMSLYDFIYAASKLRDSAWFAPNGQVDDGAVSRGLETLKGFVEPPYWDYAVENCDEAELTSGSCTLEDGSQVSVFNEGGRKGSTVCDEPVPKPIRRPSNYEWRSNPYEPNGGGEGSGLMPGVDFRIAYWTGRATRLPQ